MKFFLALIFSLSFFSISANANESQSGYSRSRRCTRNEYREEYFPGTEESPGYVKSWTETIEVPCDKVDRSASYRGPIPQKVDDNDCKEGSIIGGVLGAGLTMSSTKGKDRWWAVPLGATAGSLVGCQVDGG